MQIDKEKAPAPYGKAALERLALRRKDKIGDTGIALGSILDYVGSLENRASQLEDTLAWVRKNYASGSTSEINARIDVALSRE